MLEREINQLLQKEGYQRMALNTPEIYVYAKPQEGCCRVVIHYPENTAGMLTAAKEVNVVRQVRQYFYDAGYLKMELLSLVETKDAARVRAAFGTYENVWFLDISSERIILYEGQEDFDGLREDMDHVFRRSSSISFCNTVLVVTNILVFLLCEVFGSTLDTEFLLGHGALNYQRVSLMGEYYRIFTYMFLHSGIDHLFNNMLVLWFLGDNLEKQMGHVKYLILYFTAGILAGVVSMSYNNSIGRFVVCVGASGAIFGVSGALAFIVLVNRGHVENLTMKQMFLFIALSLYGGFTSQGVDNVAHVGGLAAGVLLALVLYRKKRAGIGSSAEKRLD